MTHARYIPKLEEAGYVHIESFYDLDVIKKINKEICHIISLVSSHYLGKEFHEDSLDSEKTHEILGHMQEHRRDLISIIYDAVKTIPEFCRLVSSEKNIELAKMLRQTDLIGIARGGEGIRMDLPQERRFMAPWHQDYLVQFGSYDGLVFWASLVDIPSEIGPVEMLSNSHKEGLLPVYYENKGPVGTAYDIRIDDEERVLKKYACEKLVCKAGDLLVFDYKTVHRSGFNASGRVRWSMQMRYFNFNDSLGLSKGWPGGLSQGKTIRQLHPELLLDQKEKKANVH